MPCVWWDNCSIIHFEFLNHIQTLNADLYTQHLQQMHENLEKHSNVLLYDNASVHSARIMQEIRLDLV